MILEAIYEGSFEHTSHGFRPKRSCHTALIDIQKTFTAVKWFIEGDIKGFFDNINHDVLINILRERIADERFLRLIRKFLNAGYVEDWYFIERTVELRKAGLSAQYWLTSTLTSSTSISRNTSIGLIKGGQEKAMLDTSSTNSEDTDWQRN